MLALPSSANPSQMADPCEESVWRKIELPALKANIKIDNIIWVNSKDQAVQRTLWTRECEFLIFG